MAIPEDGEGRVMMNDDVLACVLCVVWKVSGLFFLTLSEKLELSHMHDTVRLRKQPYRLPSRPLREDPREVLVEEGSLHLIRVAWRFIRLREVAAVLELRLVGI